MKEPMKLEVRNEGIRGPRLVLDGKELHHVKEYEIKSSDFIGKAELSLKMLVTFPGLNSGGNRPLMKHYISDIKKQAEKVTTAITGAEMREAVSSAFSDTATALETMEESYRKRGKEMLKPLAILLLFWIAILTMNE